MRVLVISHTYITRAGREKWRSLVRNHDVTLRIIVPETWRDYLFTINAKDHQDETLDVRALPVWFSGKESAHAYRTLSFGMREFRPDIVHVEEGTDALSYAQARAARRLFAPRAKTIFFTWMNFEKRNRIPFRFIERRNLAAADAAICGNADARDILRKKGFTRPVFVLPLLGIDPEVYQKRDGAALRSELGLEGCVIGFIGRFVEEKGVLDLIAAASTLRTPYSLLFVGGGALEPRMRDLAQERGIADRLHIVPPVPHADIPGYLNAMDLLVLPSYTVPHWKEQFGQVLIQAMASHVPVLGSTHAEIPNVIGDAGWTFRERDVVDLGQKLGLITASAELRAEYGLKGRLRVLEHFTNDRIADRTFEIYRSLMSIS